MRSSSISCASGGAPLALGLCVYTLAQLIRFEGQQTLWKYLEEERPDKELLEVAADLCEWVWDIHRKGIIHLDLKEDNVLVDARGRDHLIDFDNAS